MVNPTPKVETILAQAVEIASEAERQAFVAEACAGNLPLREQVERLVANHVRAGVFLEEPLMVLETIAAPTLEGPGTVIGPYTLRELIGEGGMGVVFVAEQTRPSAARSPSSSSSRAWTHGRSLPASKPSGRRWLSWSIPISPRSSTRAQPTPAGPISSWNW